MLIGNGNNLNKHPGRIFTSPGFRNGDTKAGSLRGRYFGATATSNYMSKQSAVPNGYTPPYSIVMAQVAGGIASNQIIIGSGQISSFNLAGGKSADSNIVGYGTINSASGDLILSAISEILNSGSIYYAALVGQGLVISGLTGSSILDGTAGAITGLQAVAGLTGSTQLTAQIGALVDKIANLQGSGQISNAVTYDLAFMSADIVPFTELSPQALALAVWNSIAVDNNTSGTMGNKVNSAASAGDPWSTVLPGSYTNDQAGAIVDRLEDLINQIKQLTIAQM